MERDRLTNYRGPRTAPESRSRNYLRECKWMERTLPKVAAEIVKAKREVVKHSRPAYRTKHYGIIPARTWYEVKLTPAALDSLAEWTESAVDYDGSCDSKKLEDYADRVAIAVLRQQGYPVAADADYDWIVDTLGTYAEDIYQDAYAAVLDTEAYMRTER